MSQTRIVLKEVKFNATLTGSIDDLDVVIQDRLVLTPDFVVTFDERLNDMLLRVIFQISGFNGTGFTIRYSCTSAGKAALDPNYPKDISSTIVDNGYTVIELSIPI